MDNRSSMYFSVLVLAAAAFIMAVQAAPIHNEPVAVEPGTDGHPAENGQCPSSHRDERQTESYGPMQQMEKSYLSLVAKRSR
ncbi:MAG: hypothetical protein J3R72DRAFT_493262 [Linnemannia gamsii]|nr:MAG: hypothetical protein J3R72DRAFT_493262 [Linnemannia gamsii]